MQTKLQQYFPVLRSREEILREIDATVKLTEKFYSWREAAETGISGFLLNQKSENCRCTAGRFHQACGRAVTADHGYPGTF